MNDPVVYLTDRQFDAIRYDLVNKLAADIKEAVGDVRDLIAFPMATVTQMTGLSRKTIPQKMPVIEDAGKCTVTLGAIAAYRDKYTKTPESRVRK